MKFLIDGSSVRLAERLAIWKEGIAGQFLTPLTNYKLAHPVFAIDNGAYSSFNEPAYRRLLKRTFVFRESCLFVACPDKVGDHAKTKELWEFHYESLAGWKAAFVAQDGYNGMPTEADALFIGGTNLFKDSTDARDAVKDALQNGKHVHIGRVNTPERYAKFAEIGAHTCDGSGFSRYDHMVVAIRDFVNAVR